MKINNKDIDTELILKIKDGDKQAFGKLVEKYKDMSLTLAVSILKDRFIAEDILQEVFIKVYRKIPYFKFKSKFSTWLYKIVVNSCYTQLKKNRYNLNYENVENITESKNEFILPNNNSALSQNINGILNNLKPDEALLLRLYYLFEFNINEIQEITKFSKSKIKTTLFRGRKSLELKLKKFYGNEIEDLL